MIQNHSTKNTNDIDGYIEQVLSGNKLAETDVFKLCKKAKEILAQEENVVSVNTPVTVCGGVNGRYEDLIKLFRVTGDFPEVNHLLLGNYASRSYHTGVEIISLLLAYKVRYNKKITLLRGDLDNRDQTMRYGFYDECLQKYGSIDVWKAFTDVYDYLPLIAIVEDTFFCVNSGLSPRISRIDEIESLNRAQDPHFGDALFYFGYTEPGLDDMIEDWAVGETYFSPKVTEKFLYTNNIKMLCRGKFTMEGYSFHHSGLVVTVFSTPNYVGCLGNNAAVLEIDNTLDMHFTTFEKSKWEFQQTLDFMEQEEERRKKAMQNFSH